MTELGIVADDVTGGTTVGALLAREGIEPTLCYDARTMADTVSPDEDVIITSTDSRAMKPEEAYKAVVKPHRVYFHSAPHSFPNASTPPCLAT